MGLTPSQRKGPFKNLQAPSLATGRIMMPLFNSTSGGYPKATDFAAKMMCANAGFHSD